MPKASKGTAAETVELEGYVGHLQKVEGGYTIAFETYTQNADMSPFLAGLPDNRCQAPHWGYVVRGKVSFDYGAGVETFEAGDAYYIPPGHSPQLFAGTEVVEFSPTEELDRTIEVVKRNMQSG
jgi:hypothetical protein